MAHKIMTDTRQLTFLPSVPISYRPHQSPTPSFLFWSSNISLLDLIVTVSTIRYTCTSSYYLLDTFLLNSYKDNNSITEYYSAVSIVINFIIYDDDWVGNWHIKVNNKNKINVISRKEHDNFGESIHSFQFACFQVTGNRRETWKKR